MTHSANAELIVAECQASGLGPVYIVGSFSRGVSFLTQQLRSLNLVWALFETGRISDRAKIAVIGGGLAGLTAAAALAELNCRPKLFEESDSLMLRQANSKLRFVHPHVHLWPNTSASKAETTLPFLNWNAGAAHDVRDTILRQWAEFEGRVEVRYGYAVSEIAYERGTPVAVFRTPRFHREDFDCVLLTVGFGIENLRRSQAYWEPDGLDYTIFTKQPRTWLVSGSGDGGLVDVLRLRFGDFNYGVMIDTILSDPWSDELSAHVLKIEDAAKSFSAAADLGSFLFAEYELLASKLPVSFAEKLKKKLRRDTRVYVVSPNPTPFSTPAMPLNRFLASVLFTQDTSQGLEYLQGRCEDEGVEKTKDGYLVQLSETSVPTDPIPCNRVLFRHGPESAVERLLPKSVNKEFVTRNHAKSSPSAMALSLLWPDGFYKYHAWKAVVGMEYQKADPAQSTPSGADHRVLYCGSRIRAHLSGSWVTLGCFVTLPGGGVGILSSAHGLGALGAESVGAAVEVLLGDDQSYVIGSIHSVIATRSQPSATNLADAAVVELRPEVQFAQAFDPSLKLPRLRNSRPPDFGERVFKVGAASGLTWGRIRFKSAAILLNLGMGRETIFSDVIGIVNESDVPFAKPGDSGALVVGEDGSALASLFALSPEVAFACLLDNALSALSCEWLPDARPTSPTSVIRITERELGMVTILELSGRIVLGKETEELRRYVRRLVSANRKNIILNVENVDYLDSSGIGALVAAFQVVKNSGGNLSLVSKAPGRLNISPAAKLLPFKVYATESDALASY